MTFSPNSTGKQFQPFFVSCQPLLIRLCRAYRGEGILLPVAGTEQLTALQDYSSYSSYSWRLIKIVIRECVFIVLYYKTEYICTL